MPEIASLTLGFWNLSLFTSPNLHLINANAATLTTYKLNPVGLTDKPPRVLDIAAFEATYGKEVYLQHGEWMEAAHNFISFLANITGSETSPQCIRWSQHFGYFEAAEDAEANFIAILTTDIDLRRKYASQPFKYERGFYERELNKSVMDMKMAKMKSEFETRLGSGSSSSSRPMVPPSPRGGTGGLIQSTSFGTPYSSACLRKASVLQTLASSSVFSSTGVWPFEV
ncbi:hypothetical protein B0H14DRAFT_3734750 [Mycena olivaceomarginata]|nr:hypothetical protein B0H14DRAFT_3734750 [Mycena olivaceomarginata]